MLLSLQYAHNYGGGYDIEQAERNEQFPAHVHQLIIAKPRISPANEDLEPAEKENFKIKG